MKRQSNSINEWGQACSVLGTIAIVIGVIAAFATEPWGIALAAAGLALLAYSPLLKGFAILVQNSEDQIEAREKARKEEEDNQVEDWREKRKNVANEN